MTIKKQTKSLNRLEQVIARRDLKLATLTAAQEQLRGQAAEQREALALDWLRERGVLNLPVAQLVEALSSLGPTNSSPRVAVVEPAERQTQRSTAPAIAPDVVAVAIRFGANPGETNRQVLENTGFHLDRKKQKFAGLHWNGRRRCWGGQVTPLELRLLRDQFADRVSVLAEAAGPAAAPGTPEEGAGLAPTSQPTASTEPAGEPQPEAANAPRGNLTDSAGEAASASSVPAQERSAQTTVGLPPMRPLLPSIGRIPR